MGHGMCRPGESTDQEALKTNHGCKKSAQPRANSWSSQLSASHGQARPKMAAKDANGFSWDFKHFLKTQCSCIIPGPKRKKLPITLSINATSCGYLHSR
eukprot:5797474-Amphidinium_carterae.1